LAEIFGVIQKGAQYLDCTKMALALPYFDRDHYDFTALFSVDDFMTVNPAPSRDICQSARVGTLYLKQVTGQEFFYGILSANHRDGA